MHSFINFNSFSPYMMGGYTSSSWMFWGFAAVRVLIFVGIIWLIVWAIKRFTSGNTQSFSRKDDEALTIVRERYAKGEITKEQYDVLVKDLEYRKR